MSNYIITGRITKLTQSALLQWHCTLTIILGSHRLQLHDNNSIGLYVNWINKTDSHLIGYFDLLDRSRMQIRPSNHVWSVDIYADRHCRRRQRSIANCRYLNWRGTASALIRCCVRIMSRISVERLGGRGRSKSTRTVADNSTFNSYLLLLIYPRLHWMTDWLHWAAQ